MDPDGYQLGRDVWLSQIDAHAENPLVLGNAASFFTIDDPELSEKLLIQCVALEPDDSIWQERLGALHALRARGVDVDTTAASKSFAAYQKAHEIEQQQRQDQPLERNPMALRVRLTDLARSAVEANEFELAKQYAEELLELDGSDAFDDYFRNDGDAVHFGNSVLGRVALEMGDIQAAKEHLLESGRTKGSAILMSFGPNMTLAKSLLDIGERDSVLEYLQLCGNFWALGAGELAAWTQDLIDGNDPDFGANLAY